MDRETAGDATDETAVGASTQEPAEKPPVPEEKHEHDKTASAPDPFHT